MSSSNLAKSSIIVSILLAVGYLVSFVKESIIANYYGVSADVDAYTIAITIPVILFSIVTVSIRSVIVPIYSDLIYNRTKEEADRFICNTLCSLMLVIIILITIMEVWAGLITSFFAPGFDSHTHTLSTKLLRITLPSIFFTVINDVLIGVLNVHKRFIAPSCSVFFLNIGLILTIILLHSRFGIEAAAIGYIIGGGLSVLYISLISITVFKFRPIVNWKDEYFLRTLQQILPVIWSTSIAEVNAVINRMIASFLFVGSISALSYSNKINSIFISFFITAVATIIYPLYAESAAKKDVEQLSNRINFTLSLYTMILLPIVFGVLCFREEIVSVAFARGEFDPSAVATTASLLGCYCLGLLFMSFRETLTKVFYSLQDMKTPAKNATIGIVLNVVLNLTLPYFMGVEGLAIGSSITAMFISLRLLYLLKKQRQQIRLEYFRRNVIGIVFATLLMFFVVLAFSHLYQEENNYLRLIIGAGLGVVSYVILMWVFRIPIFKQSFKMITAKNR